MCKVDFVSALKEFSDVSREAYSYAYTAGFYESQLIDLLRRLPVSEQQSFVESLKRSTETLKGKM